MQVLLIETEAPLVRLMAWFLIEAGFTVAKAEPSHDLVRRVSELNAQVVVINAGIPPEARRESIAQLREAESPPRILDVSDYAEHGRPPDTGADAYLKLPFHADDLVNAVRTLADGAHRA